MDLLRQRVFGIAAGYPYCSDAARGLIYLAFVAPEKEFGNYERTFRDMTDSIRFTQR